MSYFEVYEPLLAAGQAKVEFQMRVIDAKTGQLKVGTGSRSAQAYAHSGSSVIPIAQEIAINKLPKGAYRVEVQAVDSAGRQTPWRAASFSVE
jgi:predicted phage tail protein